MNYGATNASIPSINQCLFKKSASCTTGTPETYDLSNPVRVHGSALQALAIKLRNEPEDAGSMLLDACCIGLNGTDFHGRLRFLAKIPGVLSG
jgi:hypothetical protein